ncbi:ROK family transcriptional regulator [Microbacterium sp. T2.11-28]|uniref:ROK family transcriptional regulator n=1 Tax=Microbacterium sp. T2.11-28 TaxID=3041169 RepID=UPI002541395E|nr:ROK family protein [Microbacterium sp. T2.11-28]
MSTPLGTTATRPASLDAVLRHAWQAREFTASEVMAATGLTRSTAIEAMDTLAEMGLLEELPNARLAGDYRKGRPARRFALRADAAVLLGVDAGHARITATVTDLRSRALASHETAHEIDSEGPDARRGAVLATIDEALARAGRTRGDVLAVAVGVPAPVDAAGRSPRHPHRFWERMNPGLAEALDWAPIVRIDNDASLAAVAEGAVGAATGCTDYITLLAGDRLGAGVVVDGHLLRGSHGGVGEMVAFDHVEGVGSAHGLGAMAATWARAAVDEGRLSPDGALAGLSSDDLDGRRVLEAAAAGDPDAREIAARVGGALARIVSVLGSMFDPQRVVVSGAIAAGIDDVVRAARLALPTDLHLPAPELVVSTLGADVVVTGAVWAAADAARTAALDVWASRRAG